MMKNKKLLFIHPTANQKTRENEAKNLISGKGHEFIELSFAYLDSYLKEKIPSIETRYLDFRFEYRNGIDSVLLKMKEEFDYTHVGLTCYSRHYLNSVEIARKIKQIDGKTIVIVGGFHPTVKPGDFMLDDSPFDYIIRGEGERSIYKIISGEKGTSKHPVLVKDDGSLDINDIPPLNLDIFEDYFDHLDLKNLYIYFSRGCIHECSFCISRKLTCGMKRYRTLTRNNIKKQLDILERYSPDKIEIQDPIFGVNYEWFKKIVDLMEARERTYKVRLETHVDTLNQKRMDNLLKNDINLTVGFESASPQMLHLMNKTTNPGRYLERMKKIMAKFGEEEQELTINVLLGHPGESISTIDETFDYLNENLSFKGGLITKFSIFRIYPGTNVYINQEFFEKVLKSKFFFKNWWKRELDYSLVPSLIEPSKGLTFYSEIKYIHEKINGLFHSTIFHNERVSNSFKLFYLRFLSKINKTYNNLEQDILSYETCVG